MEKRGIRRRATKEDMETQLTRLAKHVTARIGHPAARVDIILLSNKKMIALKRRFFKNFAPAPKTRGEYPYPQADVLAFEEKEIVFLPKSEQKRLGEVYINWEIYKNDPERLAFLVIHGTLHLLGYRHQKRRDIIEMETLERTLWRQLCLSV